MLMQESTPSLQLRMCATWHRAACKLTVRPVQNLQRAGDAGREVDRRQRRSGHPTADILHSSLPCSRLHPLLRRPCCRDVLSMPQRNQDPRKQQ